MMKRTLLATTATLCGLTVLALPSLALANEGAGLPQLDPTWYASQVFWLGVHFVLLYIIAAKLILPRVGKTIATRDAKLADDLTQARKLEGDSRAARLGYEADLTAARAEAQASRQKLMAELVAAQTKAEQELTQQLLLRTKDAEKRIADAGADMRLKMKDIASDVAIDIVGKLTGAPAEKAAVDAILTRLIDSPLVKRVA